MPIGPVNNNQPQYQPEDKSDDTSLPPGAGDSQACIDALKKHAHDPLADKKDVRVSTEDLQRHLSYYEAEHFTKDQVATDNLSHALSKALHSLNNGNNERTKVHLQSAFKLFEEWKKTH